MIKSMCVCVCFTAHASHASVYLKFTLVYACIHIIVKHFQFLAHSQVHIVYVERENCVKLHAIIDNRLSC